MGGEPNFLIRKVQELLFRILLGNKGSDDGTATPISKHRFPAYYTQKKVHACVSKKQSEFKAGVDLIRVLCLSISSSQLDRWDFRAVMRNMKL